METRDPSVFTSQQATWASFPDMYTTLWANQIHCSPKCAPHFPASVPSSTEISVRSPNMWEAGLFWAVFLYLHWLKVPWRQSLRLVHPCIYPIYPLPKQLSQKLGYKDSPKLLWHHHYRKPEEIICKIGIFLNEHLKIIQTFFTHQSNPQF